MEGKICNNDNKTGKLTENGIFFPCDFSVHEAFFSIQNNLFLLNIKQY
jgi:hypothetical protein